MADKIMYLTSCEEERIKPHRFTATTRNNKKRKLLQNRLKELPTLMICGVSGCNHCKTEYNELAKELYDNYSCDTVELFRVQEPSVRIWVKRN